MCREAAISRRLSALRAIVRHDPGSQVPVRYAGNAWSSSIAIPVWQIKCQRTAAACLPESERRGIRRHPGATPKQHEIKEPCIPRHSSAQTPWIGKAISSVSRFLVSRNISIVNTRLKRSAENVTPQRIGGRVTATNSGSAVSPVPCADMSGLRRQTSRVSRSRSVAPRTRWRCPRSR